jgi:hypothetical protein
MRAGHVLAKLAFCASILSFFFDMANSLLGEHLRMENREVVWIVEEEEMKDGC